MRQQIIAGDGVGHQAESGEEQGALGSRNAGIEKGDRSGSLSPPTTIIC
jgi:hypothetical protein